MSFTQIAKHFIAYYVFTYEYMPFRIGRTKTTGRSHNKKASTYTGKQSLSKRESKQWTLSAFLNKSKQQDNEEATTSTIVTEDIESEQLETDNESSEETASDICVTSNFSDDKASSIVNEGIRVILNLFIIIIFFYKKISHEQKSKNAYKQTKTKKTAFLCA